MDPKADHSSLHGRVSLDLGKTQEKVQKLPLAERLKLHKKQADHPVLNVIPQANPESWRTLETRFLTD